MTDTATADARRLADEYNLRFVDLTQTAIAPGAAQLLPEEIARQYCAVPIGRRLGTPVIALAQPDDLYTMDTLRVSLGREFVAVVARADQIMRVIDKIYAEADQERRSADAAPESSWSGTGTIPEPPAPSPVAAPASGSGTGWEGVPGFDTVIPPATASEITQLLAPPPPPATGVAAFTPISPELASSLEAAAQDIESPVPAFLSDVPVAPVAVVPASIDGPPLARLLVEAGRVSVEAMQSALGAHQQTGEALARYLFTNKIATEDDLVWAMAREVGLEFVDLNQINIDRAAAALIPEATAVRHSVLPIGFEGGMPVVAMANPTDVFAMDDLRSIMGRNFKPVVATRSQIETFLRIVRDSSKEVGALAQEAADSSGNADAELQQLQAIVEDAPIVRYVNLLILQALNERASDIHIEPTPNALRIRFRIDGVMHDTSSASPTISSAVVSRLKVLGEMDIAEHRIPQEGRVSVSMSDRQIDLRLATLPSVYGETVVMRLLDKSRSLRTLPELGFSPDTLDRYSKAYKQPYGVIVVTGPTGAGKTTTLYATLAEILTPEKSVVTVEDPVEYQIDGVTQVQINPKAGLLFSTALRSILRADPDIVLIGEVRDPDTAKIAMEAALSGHLVLTTLHTNTAAATPLRLTEMGVEPFLVTSAVGSVLTQRLARVLCSVCKEAYDASEKEFYAAGYADADLEKIDISTLYRAVGCRTCAHTGYLSRVVLAEVMNVSEEIERMIIHQASIAEVERMACEQGMRTLRQDGLLKAIQGITTLEEVLRVVV
jgi:type IV pilus assembly protein PilB